MLTSSTCFGVDGASGRDEAGMSGISGQKGQSAAPCFRHKLRRNLHRRGDKARPGPLLLTCVLSKRWMICSKLLLGFWRLRAIRDPRQKLLRPALAVRSRSSCPDLKVSRSLDHLASECIPQLLIHVYTYRYDTCDTSPYPCKVSTLSTA